MAGCAGRPARGRPRPALIRRALLAGLAVLALACRAKPELPAPVVEYSGCWAVRLPGPVCALYPPGPGRSESPLRLWVKAEAGTAVEIRDGERLLRFTGEEAQGGRRFLLQLPPKVSSLTVRLRQPDGRRTLPWSLALSPPEVPAGLVEANQLAGLGKLEEARRLLDQARKTAPRNEQGILLHALASLARRANREDEAVADLQEGLAIDRATKLLSGVGGEVEVATMLARVHRDHGRFSEAREVLEGLRLPAAAPADARYLLAYNQGLLAEQVGNYRTALEQLRTAADTAERVGKTPYRWTAELVLARVLQGLGRSREAAASFAALRADPHPESACDLGSLLTTEAWTLLLAQEGGEEARDPLPLLREARDVLENKGCGADQRLHVEINLALAHQQARRWSEARLALAEVRPLADRASLVQRLWLLDLEGRQAIAEGRPDRALRDYGELAERARRGGSLEGGFRAAVGRANAKVALGRRAAAVADLAAADHLVDEQAWLIPADQGRDTFIVQRERATRLYLQILLDEGERQRALDLVRRARSRLLRQLAVRDRLAQLTPAEQRRWDAALSRYWALRGTIDRLAAEEWQLLPDQVPRARADRLARLAAARRDLDAAMASLGAPVEPREASLAPPGPGEVLLAYHPLPSGWAGFAADAHGIEVATFTMPPGALSPRRPRRSHEDLARLLLAPFRAVLGRADRVRVLAYGPLQRVDFHALPLDGETLLARHAVVYSLDLPALSSAALPDHPAALLVSDSEGNLPAARQEAEEVGRAVQGWGRSWTLERLDGRAAGAEAVRRALARADLFHFAGHGSFAGLAGWDSALRMADGSSLSLSDLLALGRAPSWVVLSACDGGHASEQAPGEGVGLAQAFLLAGARNVIAATRAVPDRTARDLVRELYRGWQPGADLAGQLRRAQLAGLQHSPGAGWESFRLFVR